MTDIGRRVTAKGVKPIVKYKHAFKNTYLYGSFSPLNGDSFVYEIEGVSSEIFYKYLVEFSKYKPTELKIVFIDNAGFHSLKNHKLPENMALVRIPPYSPELNPCERVWEYIKAHFKNRFFDKMDDVRSWLYDFIRESLSVDVIKSLTGNETYTKSFYSP